MTRQMNDLIHDHIKIFVIVISLILLWIIRCLYHMYQTRRRMVSRGEYRQVTAHYIDHDFDDTLVHDDINDDDYEEEDEDEEEGWSSGKRTIEMSSFGDDNDHYNVVDDDDGLSLEEVNG